MTGVIGGQATPSRIDAMADALYHEEWYRTRRECDAGFGVAVADHGDRDRRCNTVWRGENALGVLYGVLSATGDRSGDPADVFRAVLDRPEEVLPALEGPFVIAVIDTETGRIRVATDKVGSRPCYYAAGDGFRFASELTPLLDGLDDYAVDEGAIGDLLAFGAVLGEKTVLEGIDALPPATYLTYDAGEVTTTRYWSPTFRAESGGDYVGEWIETHQRALDDVVETVDGSLGLWLSGGIDSRVTAGGLHRNGRSFEAYTYATGEGGNVPAARQVADRLGVPCHCVSTDDASATDLIDAIRDCVATLDAMQSWAYVPVLPFVFDGLAETVDVMMEGGLHLGEDLSAYYLRNDVAPVETLYRTRGKLPPGRVADLLDAPVDPRRSLRRVVDRCRAPDPGDRSVDAIFRLYAYLHMRSNAVQRSQIGTRVLTSGPFLSHVVNLPEDLRMRSVPFTDGTVPLGVAPLKLRVVRRLDNGLEVVPYERTGLAPDRPLPLHVAGAGLQELRGQIATDPPTHLSLVRRHDELRRFLASRIDEAGDRPFLDADAVADLWEGFLDGTVTAVPVAALTGLECWLQTHVDPQPAERPQPAREVRKKR